MRSKVIPRTLTDFDSPYRISGDERNYQECPVCGATDGKVYVNMKTGKWNCFTPAHGGGGVIEVEGWVAEMHAELVNLMFDITTVGEEWLEVDLPAWIPLTGTAQRYLNRRGITEETIRYCGMVEQVNTPRIIIPFKGPQGRLIGATGRAFMSTLDHEPKYLNLAGGKAPFVLPQWDRYDTAVLVEGPMDALKVWQTTSLPVVAIGGSTISERIMDDLSYLVRHTVHIMLDGEAINKSIDLFHKLMDQYVCQIIPIDVGKDPGNLDPEVIRELLCRR